MDPGPQIYFSKNKNDFWSKMIFEQQNQKKNPEKKTFFQKRIGKNKICEKIFLKKM